MVKSKGSAPTGMAQLGGRRPAKQRVISLIPGWTHAWVVAQLLVGVHAISLSHGCFSPSLPPSLPPPLSKNK